MSLSDTYRTNILKAILILVAGVILWWGYSSIEYRIEEKDRGYQGEALTNHYLAAEYFLLSMGQQSEKISLFSVHQKDLQVNDTLFIPGARVSLNMQRSKDLLNWVETGGHLIITGNPVMPDGFENYDNILDELGLRIEWKVNEDESFEDDLPLDLEVVSENDFWQVDFVDYQVLGFKNNVNKDNFSYEIVWTIENENKIHGLQIKYGEGHLTLLSDTKMFRNQFIDHYDHAAFLFSLSNVQAEFDNPGVFYYSLYENKLSLYRWLLDNAWPFMVSLLLLIVVILWMLVPRFGPVINVNSTASRRFLDHLSASGNYHWRQGNYMLLLNHVRKQLSVRTQVKYPEWINLSKSDQLNHFADLSQMNVAVIKGALFDADIENMSDFVKKVKVLEKLRKSL
ncbi:hypothetical protein MNBD_GAMMA09-2335 [hydrothermal vent metagenome]|uniref:DUF4350 domain-containing protein n=1 Tax=hydrothermal vent metagenome TaxID=652676 RepID=A0A3B0XI14_9ZZZZ